MAKLEEMIQTLPPDLKKQVEDFVKSLIEKRFRKSSRRLNLSWRGGLRHLRDQYTSMELQKKANEWRTEHVSSGHKHNSGTDS